MQDSSRHWFAALCVCFTDGAARACRYNISFSLNRDGAWELVLGGGRCSLCETGLPHPLRMDICLQCCHATLLGSHRESRSSHIRLQPATNAGSSPPRTEQLHGLSLHDVRGRKVRDFCCGSLEIAFFTHTFDASGPRSDEHSPPPRGERRHKKHIDNKRPVTPAILLVVSSSSKTSRQRSTGRISAVLSKPEPMDEERRAVQISDGDGPPRDLQRRCCLPPPNEIRSSPGSRPFQGRFFIPPHAG